MSLKAFHIVFVTLSTILAAGFGAWAVRDYKSHGEVASHVIGIASLIGAVALVWYGRWFLQKLRGVSYL